MTHYRAVFDASVRFANGGGMTAEGFRLDLPSRELTEDEIGMLFVRHLGLALVADVTLSNLRIVEEQHKGSRSVPSAPPVSAASPLVDLSHPIRHGQATYPGLPAPQIAPHLTREASRDIYAPGTEFEIDVLTMVGNTGTYLDSPYHRHADGVDLAGLPLEQLADLPAVVVRRAGSGRRGVAIDDLAGHDVAGCAVLLHTGGDAGFGTPAYAEDAPFLTEDGAQWLAEHGAALVGIDAVNIDELTGRGERPAHTVLLGAGIPVVEHLTGLDAVPDSGARFTAAPPRFAGFGTFPVRAYARLLD